MKNFILLVIAAVVLNYSSIAQHSSKIEEQKTTIEGVVVNNLGERLDGVLIELPYQQRAAVTSSQGEFKIEAPEGGKLTFTLPNYYKEVVEPRSNYIKVVLTPRITPISNNEVAIGYGERKKFDLTYSTTHITAEQLTKYAPLPLSQAIAGVSSSVIVDCSDVYDPLDTPKITIRGATSLNGGNPLILVDEVEIESIDMIPTSAVSSITILKDGASTAIFGSKGGNGAILISTKGCNIGKLTVSYHGSYSIEVVSSAIDRLSTEQYSQIYNSLISSGEQPELTPITSTFNKNWEQELYQKSPQQSHTLHLKGGIERVHHSTALKFEFGDGVVKNSNHKAISATTSIETKLLSWLKWGVNSNFAHYQSQQPYTELYNSGVSGVSGVIAQASTTAPWVESMPSYLTLNSKKEAINGATYLLFTPHPTTKIRGEISYNTPEESSLYSSSKQLISYKGYGNFTKSIGNVLQLDAMAGFTSQKSDNLSRENSFMARTFFSLYNRYLIEGSINCENSTLTSAKEWELYPSLSAAWRINSEEAFHIDPTVVNLLKLRSSIGKSGSSSLIYYPTLTKESAITWDLGLDLVMFGSLTFSADYYIKNSQNVAITTSSTASVCNSGVELLIDWSKSYNDFDINLSATMSYNQNEITALSGNNLYYDNSHCYVVGGSIGSFYLYKALFLHTSQESVNKYYYNTLPLDSYTATPYVDFAYSDTNNNKMIDSDDRVVVGNELPKISYNFKGAVSWKGIELSAEFSGKAGVNRYFSSSCWGEFAGDSGNPSTFWLSGLECNENSTTPYPSLSNNSNSSSSTRPSTYYLVNSSYLRLSLLSVGYTIPRKISEKISSSSLRIYYLGQNLATWHNMPLDINPEAASYSLAPLPSTKTHSFGVSITF